MAPKFHLFEERWEISKIFIYQAQIMHCAIWTISLDLIYIFLGSGAIDGNVEPQDLLPDDPKQMWKKEKADNEGYFILRNCFSQQVLTAGAGDKFEITGTVYLLYIIKMGEHFIC